MQRLSIAIENDGIGFELAVVSERDAARLPPLDVDSADCTIQPNFNAEFARRAFKARCDRLHAAFCRPDPPQFNISDQGEGGGCLPRRATAVGGVSAKELSHARIVKMPSQALPQACEGPKPAQQRKSASAQVASH